LTRRVAKDGIKGKPVLSIIDHRVVIFEVSRMNCRPEPAIDSNVLAFVLTNTLKV